MFSANECIGILQVFEKVPFEKLSTPHLGTLFLQLTVEDMGICIPLNPLPPVSTNYQECYTPLKYKLTNNIEATLSMKPFFVRDKRDLTRSQGSSAKNLTVHHI